MQSIYFFYGSDEKKSKIQFMEAGIILSSVK